MQQKHVKARDKARAQLPVKLKTTLVSSVLKKGNIHNTMSILSKFYRFHMHLIKYIAVFGKFMVKN